MYSNMKELFGIALGLLNLTDLRLGMLFPLIKFVVCSIIPASLASNIFDVVDVGRVK